MWSLVGRWFFEDLALRLAQRARKVSAADAFWRSSRLRCSLVRWQSAEFMAPSLVESVSDSSPGLEGSSDDASSSDDDALRTLIAMAVVPVPSNSRRVTAMESVGCCAAGDRGGGDGGDGVSGDGASDVKSLSQ